MSSEVQKAVPTVKKVKSMKGKVVPSHPTYSVMVRAAIVAMKDKKGSSRAAILKYILQNYKVGDSINKVNARLRFALKKGAVNGLLKQVNGVGATGSFKLGEGKASTTKAKKPIAKKAKKPAAEKAKKEAKHKVKKDTSSKKAAKPKKATSPKKTNTPKKSTKPKKSEVVPKSAKPKKAVSAKKVTKPKASPKKATNMKKVART